jgi:chromosome partitioning protein
MIITFVNANEHLEKSILAVNLTAFHARNEGKVLLIDADTYKHSFLWSVRRSNAGMKLKVPVLPIINESLYSELERLSSYYRDVVIDTGEVDAVETKTALVAARVAVIPVCAGQDALQHAEKLIDCIESAVRFNPTLRTLVALMRPAHGASDQGFAAALAFAGRIPSAQVANTIIHDRMSIHKAFDHGLAGFEYQAVDESATAEWERLYEEVLTARGGRLTNHSQRHSARAMVRRWHGSGLQRSR